MRILQCLTSLDPVLGGSVEAARQIAIALQSRGVEMEALSLNSADPDWLDHWPMPVNALGGSVSYFSYTNRLVSWMRSNARRFDAVIVNGVWRYTGYGVRDGLQGSGVPYFVFTHGMLDPWFQAAYPLKHIKKSIYWKLAESKVLRDAKAVLFTSEEERLLARKAFQPFVCRQHVTGLGTIAPPNHASLQQNAFHKRFPELAGKRIILSLGRIHPKKGIDLLVPAFLQICALDDRLQLVIAGQGEDGWQAELKSIAARAGLDHRITWTGQLDGDLKWGAFRAADVFVLPSHSENYGIVVAEALGCGKPVLISDKVNIWREIDQDRAGLVNADDLTGTIALLKTWLALPDESRRQMIQDARRCFSERFEMNRFLDRFIDFLSAELSASERTVATTA